MAVASILRSATPPPSGSTSSIPCAEKAGRIRSATPPPTCSTPGMLRAEKEKKELSLLWSRLTERGKEVEDLEKRLAEQDVEITQLRREVDTLSTRLRKEQNRAQDADARGRRLHRELGNVLGLSLSPSPTRCNAGLSPSLPPLRAQTPPARHGLGRSRSPCFGRAFKAELLAAALETANKPSSGHVAQVVPGQGEHKPFTHTIEDSIQSVAAVQDGFVARTDTMPFEAGQYCKNLAAAESPKTPSDTATIVPEDTPEVVEQAEMSQTMEAKAAEAIAQAENRAAALQMQVKERESELQRRLQEREAELQTQLQERESELAHLRKAHASQAARLVAVRRKTLAMRRHASQASAQVSTTRRKAAEKARRIQAERVELEAWRNELMAWWEAKSGDYLDEVGARQIDDCHRDPFAGDSITSHSTPVAAASAAAESLVVQGTDSTSDNGCQQFFIGDSDDDDQIEEVADGEVLDEISCTDEKAEQELSSGTCPADGVDAVQVCLNPALLPNCSRDSRRIARGGAAPSRFGSMLKKLKPKKRGSR